MFYMEFLLDSMAFIDHLGYKSCYLYIQKHSIFLLPSGLKRK